MTSADAGPPPGRGPFPRLKRGPRSISAEEAAEHQKARVEEAMLRLAARNGLSATTVNDIVAMAGVSKATFYELFADKEDCFLQTLDDSVVRIAQKVATAYGESGDFREKMIATITKFMDLVIEEEATARLVTIESLGLGAVGIAHREKTSAGFELLVRRSFETSPSRVEVSDIVVRGIVAGVQGVVYRHLRENEVKALPALVDDLVDWGLSYQRRPSAAVGAAMRAAAEPLPSRADAGAEAIPWEDPPAGERARAALGVRERIERAAAQVVVEHGYGALSIPAISAVAGISNATFYTHFSSKREAFLGAFAEITAEALRVGAEAADSGGEGPEAIGRSIRALLELFAERELFSRLAFVELPGAGPVALDRADEVIDRLGAYRNSAAAPGGLELSLPASLEPAVASAIWGVIQHEIVKGRRRSLADLAPQVTLIATMPFRSGSGSSQQPAKRRASSAPR